MTPRNITYLLQAGALALMLFSMFLGYVASTEGWTSAVALNCVLFWINFALFYWQSRIRSSLGDRP